MLKESKDNRKDKETVWKCMTFQKMTTNIKEFQTHCTNHYIKYKLSKHSESRDCHVGSIQPPLAMYQWKKLYDKQDIMMIHEIKA